MKKETSTKKNVWPGILGIAIIISLVYVMCGTEETAISPQAQHEKRIENQFSAIDGSHKTLKEYVKKTMTDPDSYQNLETKYVDKDSFLIVTQSFTGKNRLGGVEKGFISAHIDTNGNIIKVLIAP